MAPFRKVHSRPLCIAVLCSAQVCPPACDVSDFEAMVAGTSYRFLVRVQTHKRSSAWWIRCNCLSEYVLLERTAFENPNSTYLSNQKWASNKSNSSVTSSCASCGFLRSRLESQKWNSVNPFPIVNWVSAGVPTPPDSGNTPQLKTSKLAQNCGKTEVLHLQPSSWNLLES